ncbi:ribonuclease P protein subunit p40-like isoform X2 [Malaya genurostris]|uniref:ribonuclease P protein subunit p40-like isoform X2 n=1 Tax=Malaya genurostris TaxID=325434 RepID=UPI0026F3B615|nr:ribonuclease P protein subunit p40-like isoform X2 [Malaya genurostris]XP_058444822.1 ribonuclease P protein subunit p40-like isoform X2 [Malaya genurostris]
MLCPEVWRFSAPSHEILQKTGTIDLKKQKKDPIINGIRSHHFNQMITIILPDASSIPATLEATLADSDHYLVRNLSLDALVARSFIEGFVKRGTFYAVSFRTRLDTEDCVAVTPNGTLVLHLNKETYQTLGLEGRVSQFARKRNTKYVVQIDLKTLRPESKHYERIRARLGREILGQFNVQIAWTPPPKTGDSGVICPSSVAKYFADDATGAVKVELMPTLVKTHQEYGLKVPVFSLTEPHDEVYCNASELIEYMGMLALSCDLEEQDYVNSYDFCGERVEVGNAKVMHWRGLFTTVQVQSVYQQLLGFLEKEKHVPWLGMYVHGFADSPISFGMRENYFHTDGDNSYAVVVNPKGEYLWYQLVGNNKLPK